MTYQDAFGHFFDYEAQVSGLGNSEDYWLKTNVIVHAEDELDPANWFSRVEFYALSGVLYIYLYRKGGGTASEDLLQRVVYGANPGTFAVRIVYNEDIINVYVDGSLVLSHKTEYVRWQDPIRLYAYGASVTHSYVIRELAAPRDGLYVDLDSTSLNAIQSTIQQRPVEVVDAYLAGAGHEVQFYYKQKTRATVELPPQIDDHNTLENQVPGAAGDIIVYSANVQVLQNKEYLAERGFRTTIYRLPDLDSDALSAARIVAAKAHAQESVDRIVLRLDPSVQKGDLILIRYTNTDGHVVDKTILVDRFSVDIESAVGTMEIYGYKEF